MKTPEQVAKELNDCIEVAVYNFRRENRGRNDFWIREAIGKRDEMQA